MQICIPGKRGNSDESEDDFEGKERHLHKDEDRFEPEHIGLPEQ